MKPAESLNLRDYVDQLLDDSRPLGRYFEEVETGAFTADQVARCFEKI